MLLYSDFRRLHKNAPEEREGNCKKSLMPAAGSVCLRRRAGLPSKARRRKFEKRLDFGKSSGIITTVLCGENSVDAAVRAAAMEKSPSWSRAHDWKSCRPLKGLEGSNPSFSAMKNPVTAMVTGFFILVALMVILIRIFGPKPVGCTASFDQRTAVSFSSWHGRKYPW